MSHEQVRVVQVAVAPNEVIALMWQQVLADEGIIAALTAGGVGRGFASNALNEHYVLVREDQAELARAIIDDFESADDESDSSDSAS